MSIRRPRSMAGSLNASARSAKAPDFSSMRRKDSSSRQRSQRRSTTGGGGEQDADPRSITPPRFQFVYSSLSHSQQHEAMEAYFKFDNVESEVPDMLNLLGLYVPEDFSLNKIFKEMNQDQASGFLVSAEGFMHVVNLLWDIHLKNCGEDADIRNAYEALDARVKSLTSAGNGGGGEGGNPGNSPPVDGESPPLRVKMRTASVTSQASSTEEDAIMASPTFSMYLSPRGESGRRWSHDSMGSNCSKMSASKRKQREEQKKEREDPLLILLQPLMNREFKDFRRFLRTKEEDPVFIAAFKRLGANRNGEDFGPLVLDSDTLRQKCSALGCDDGSTQIILNFFDDDVNGEIDFKEFRRILTMDVQQLMSAEILEYMRRLLCFDEKQLQAAVARQDAANAGPMGRGRNRHKSLVHMLSSHALKSDVVDPKSKSGRSDSVGPRGSGGNLTSGDWLGEYQDSGDEDAEVSASVYPTQQSQVQFALKKVERQIEKIKNHVNIEMGYTSEDARRLLRTADKMTSRGAVAAEQKAARRRRQKRYENQRAQKQDLRQQRQKKSSQSPRRQPPEERQEDQEGKEHGPPKKRKAPMKDQVSLNTSVNTDDTAVTQQHIEESDESDDSDAFLPELGPDRNKPWYRDHVKCQFEYRPKVKKLVLPPQQPHTPRANTALVPERKVFLGALPNMCSPRQNRSLRISVSPKEEQTTTEQHGDSRSSQTTQSSTQERQRLRNLCKQVISGYSLESRQVADNPLLFSAHIQKATLPKRASAIANRQMAEETITMANGRYYQDQRPALPTTVRESIQSVHKKLEGGDREENTASRHYAAQSYDEANTSAQSVYGLGAAVGPRPPNTALRPYQPYTARV